MISGFFFNFSAGSVVIYIKYVKWLVEQIFIAIDIYIYKSKMSVCVCVSLSTHQLSMVDLRTKPMAYLESAGSCGCFSLVLND